MRKVLVIPIIAALAGCGQASDRPEPQAARSPASSPSPQVIDGKFDVGGHSLYIKCGGTGSPTVVYMHGAVFESSIVPHKNGERFIELLGDQHRVCVYDRRNLGESDTVDAPQLPKDAINEMRNLLAAADIDPPYVLLGASFGGLLAYLYANTYPEDVVGMVLLDSPFPDELTLEHLLPREDKYKTYSEEDEQESLERISHYKAHKAVLPYIGKEPAIPVTFFSSIPESDAVVGIPEFDKRVLRLQKAYVERFSPGRYLRVDAPHFMEPAIPEQIAEELRGVISEAGF
jgi:pimeloyl-ACP methyl ester carboxylesterase